MSTEQPTFISLLTEGYEFSARKNDKENEIWLVMRSDRGSTLERCPVTITTTMLHARLEVLAVDFTSHQAKLEADPNSCTLGEMLAHQRDSSG